LPETRAGLYWEAVMLLLDWRGKQLGSDMDAAAKDIHLKLGQLAYAMLVNRPRGIFDSKEATQFLDDNWHRLWQEQGGGLLVTRGLIECKRPRTHKLNAADYWFGFPHLTFAEYFAGCYLVSGTLEEAKERILRSCRWRG